jgi:hypothetical protein
MTIHTLLPGLNKYNGDHASQRSAARLTIPMKWRSLCGAASRPATDDETGSIGEGRARRKAKESEAGKARQSKGEGIGGRPDPAHAHYSTGPAPHCSADTNHRRQASLHLALPREGSPFFFA